MDGAALGRSNGRRASDARRAHRLSQRSDVLARRQAGSVGPRAMGRCGSGTQQTGAALQTLEGHTDSVSAVTFSLDGKQVALALGDGTVRLWDAATGAALQTLVGHTDWVHAVTFSPDDKQVASASGDATVRLWDAATGAALQTLEGHTDSVHAVTFSCQTVMTLNCLVLLSRL